VRALNGLRQLHRVANEHDVPGGSTSSDYVSERNLASLVDKKVIELLIVLGSSEQPCGSANQRICPETSIIVAVGNFNRRIDWRTFAGDLLDRLQRELLLTRPRRDGRQQIVDRFVGVRGDGHAPSLPDERQDCMRADIRLAGPRRALNWQVAPVEAMHCVDGRRDNIYRNIDQRRLRLVPLEAWCVLGDQGFNCPIPAPTGKNILGNAAHDQLAAV